MQVFGSRSTTNPKHSVPTEQLLLSNKETLFPPCAAESSCSWCRSAADQGRQGRQGHRDQMLCPSCGAPGCVWPGPGTSALRSCRARSSKSSQCSMDEGGRVGFIQHWYSHLAALLRSQGGASAPRISVLKGLLEHFPLPAF